MSNWRSDPEGAADQLIRRSLDDLGIAGRVLLAYQAGDLPAALKHRGITASVWNRRLAGGHAATPWPQGVFDMALLRLPKAKDEQEMATHATLGVLADGGRLIVYGGNDEGIRSAAAMLAELCGSVDTLATRGHGRVLSVRRPADTIRLRAPLSAWRTTSPTPVGGSMRDWASYPGIFANGRIDEGTALLVAHLPPLGPGARVLDYGCGSGLIAASAQAQQPDIALTLIDNDTVALEAARANVPGARFVLGLRVSDAGKTAYHAVLSNPPLHAGVSEDHTFLDQLIGDAPRHLVPGGVLQMVVQRRVPLDRLLAKPFAHAAVVAETGHYRIWRASAKS